MSWRSPVFQEFEAELATQGVAPVAGVDEVGRGALAGPVVAAAIILPLDARRPLPQGIRDSKCLSRRQREILFPQLRRCATACAIGLATRAEVDRLNIRNATLLAMQRAVDGLAVVPRQLLIDGRETLEAPCAQRAIVNGDRHCISIAAASIVAKVARDHMMLQMDEHFPQYGFKQHVGYGTVAHRTAIGRHGLCPEHRRSFRIKPVVTP